MHRISSRTRVFCVFVMGCALAGCEGDTGPAGAQGPAGPPGSPGPAGPGVSATMDIGDAELVSIETTAASVASPATVQFRLSAPDGTPLTGLPAGSISFMIARLVPGVDGNPSEWQSYVTRTEEADGGDPDVLAAAVQASTENGGNGALTDNGDGSYSYVFATDLDNAAVPFDATLTHRVGIEIRGFAPTTGNGTYTFRPSDGATSGLFSREIVADASCNGCHDKLALHGGARFEAAYCVTCHNPGSVDQDSGNTVDFTTMVHKIHMGAALPSVVGGGVYEIYGFRESRHDYSGVIFPQDVRNCRNCHDENNPDTPDAANWLAQPTVEACGSCHDDIDFETGIGHSGANLAATNADCMLCHSPDGFVGPVDESHAILEQLAAQKYQFNILDISDTAPGEFPSVSFSVTDPTNGDAPYDILNDAPFTQGGGASRLAVDIGWSTTDYSNTGSGSEVPGFRPGSAAQMVSLNPLSSAVDNGDGTFAVTSGTAIPVDVTGSGLVAIEGHPAEDINGSVERIPVGGTTAFFAITDSEAQARRNVVDIDNCLVCHQQLSIHGNNRTDNIDLCVGCHNANATDIRARTEGGVDASNAPDGLDEQTIDFKRMIHRIHYGEESDAGFYVYGFGGGLHDYSEVVFPGSLNKCTHCHTDDGYFPVGTDVLATTIDTGADLGDPLDDINITPNTAVCSGCHESQLAAEHMKQNGGAFDAMQTADGTLISASAGTVFETCQLCHGPGADAAVDVAHGLD